MFDIQRINKVVDWLKLEGIIESRRDLASKLGYTESSLSQILNGKVAISDRFIKKLSIMSNSLNIDWISSGEGEMLKSVDKPKEEVKIITSEEGEFTNGSPYYNVDFIGGFDLVINNQTIHPDYYINFRPYNKPGVIWCNLTGKSMEPELNNGDMIAIKELNTPVDFLPFGEIYAIVTDDYRTVKRITKSDKEGYIRLVPTNPAPEYVCQDIPVSIIRRVFAVMGSVKRF